MLWDLMKNHEGHNNITLPEDANAGDTTSFKFEKAEDIAVGRKRITFKIQATATNN